MKKFFYRLVIALTLISLAFSLAITIYVSRYIDFSVDETLFVNAKGVNPTRFFYIDDNLTPIEFYSIYSSGNKKEWGSFEEINPDIKNAFIATEDRDFYRHNGVNFKRTLLAALNTVFHFQKRFGASTITQQLIKNISGDNENTLKRKINEIIRAIKLERGHGKEEIFELYLNIVPMGNGISGVTLASEYYFGKEQNNLTLAESALIAGITNAPSRYNPINNPKESVKRRNVVLLSMLDSGFISNDEYESAITEELKLNNDIRGLSAVYPWFVETVCDDLCADLLKEKNMSYEASRLLISKGGLEIYTTMDADLQRILDEYFTSAEFLSDNGLKYAMTIYDSKTMDLKAIVGNKGEKSANRITSYASANIIPGSSIKPLSLYAPILETKKYNWASIFDDSPVSFVEQNGALVEYPRNYPRSYSGNITLADALCYSKNTVAIRIFNLLNKEKVFKSLKNDLGFDSLVDKMTVNGKTVTDIAPAPLALGQLSVGVSLRKLTEAYGVFINGGIYIDGRSYTRVTNNDGSLLIEKDSETREIFSKSTAQIMTMMLSEVVEKGTASAITLNEIVDTAGKTGTSGGDKDRLFIGFTPYYLAGIWCGYADNATAIGRMEKSHLVIWDEIMHSAHRERLDKNTETEIFKRDTISYLGYCKDSGMLFGESCLYDPRGDRLEYGYFSGDSRPKKICDKHIICYWNNDGSISDYPLHEQSSVKIALLDISPRDFPIDIYVEDEKYAYRRKYD